jgi:hypothetical protein
MEGDSWVTEDLLKRLWIRDKFEKSTFHVAGLDDTGLAPFKELFPLVLSP